MDIKNMAGEEISLHVNSGKIDLNSLNEEELIYIWDKETEAIHKDKSHDITLLTACSEALSQYEDSGFFEFASKKYSIDDLEAKLLSEERNKGKKVTTHIPSRRKLIALIAAVAIMISILSVSINSEWSPFKPFVDDIWDIFDMTPGTVISNENQDFIKLESVTYDSIEKLVSDTGYNILCLKDTEPKKIEFINAAYQGICICYNDDRIVSVYLTNAPYNRDNISTSEDIEHIEVNGRILHQSWIFENLIQAVLFDGDYVYVLTAENEEILHKMAEDLVYTKAEK